MTIDLYRFEFCPPQCADDPESYWEEEHWIDLEALCCRPSLFYHQLPRDWSKREFTLGDFGGICWPDGFSEFVATHTGAINAYELYRVVRVHNDNEPAD